jgi:hypothetical protein
MKKISFAEKSSLRNLWKNKIEIAAIAFCLIFLSFSIIPKSIRYGSNSARRSEISLRNGTAVPAWRAAALHYDCEELHARNDIERGL